MDNKCKEAFYIGAALYLDLDSFEVDKILMVAGLDANKDLLADCRAAVRQAEPERFANMKEL